MTVGDRIREFRIKKKISQAELARECNYSRGYLSMIETGKVEPPEETLNTIADKLNIPLINLIEVSNQNKTIVNTLEELTTLTLSHKLIWYEISGGINPFDESEDSFNANVAREMINNQHKSIDHLKKALDAKEKYFTNIDFLYFVLSIKDENVYLLITDIIQKPTLDYRDLNYNNFFTVHSSYEDLLHDLYSSVIFNLNNASKTNYFKSISAKLRDIDIDF